MAYPQGQQQQQNSSQQPQPPSHSSYGRQRMPPRERGEAAAASDGYYTGGGGGPSYASSAKYENQAPDGMGNNGVRARGPSAAGMGSVGALREHAPPVHVCMCTCACARVHAHLQCALARLCVWHVFAGGPRAALWRGHQWRIDGATFRWERDSRPQCSSRPIPFHPIPCSVPR